MSCEELDLNKYYETYQKIDKAYQVRPVTSHFNDIFLACVSNDSTQGVDEYIIKFKERSSMRQYVKNKPINWELKFWYHYASKTGYLYQFDLYFGKTESREENAGPVLSLSWQNALKARTVPFSLTISSKVHPLSSSFSTKTFTKLVLLEWIVKECRE